MDAKERECRIRNRIHKVAHQVGTTGNDIKILALERHDAQVGYNPEHLRHAVALKTGAVDCKPGKEVAPWRHDLLQAILRGRNAVDSRVQVYRAAKRLDYAAIGPCDLGVIHDSGHRDENAAGTAYGGLDAADFVTADPGNPLDAVCAPAFHQGMKPAKFFFILRDNQLAATFVRDAVFFRTGKAVLTDDAVLPSDCPACNKFPNV